MAPPVTGWKARKAIQEGITKLLPNFVLHRSPLFPVTFVSNCGTLFSFQVIWILKTEHLNQNFWERF